MGEQILDRAELADQFAGSLLANPWNAGNIVRAVAHQGENIHHLVRTLNSPALENLLHPHDLDPFVHARWFVNENFVVHELAEIFVWRDHVGNEILLLSNTSERSDNIVRLPAVEFKDGNIERFDHAPDMGQGRT